MEELKPAYLVMVTADNHNKYYRMIPYGNTFEVEYGRVGASCQKRTYGISQWNKKYREKIGKGYVDQTHLVQDLIQKEEPKNKNKYKEIENKVIAEIVDRLQAMAINTVSANYKVSSQQVTNAMVDEAQKIIDKIASIDNIKEFNKTLLELFSVIPRRMSSVSDYLAKSTDDFSRIIKDEQDLLDVMRGQVITHVVTDTAKEKIDNSQSDMTILEAMGLVFEEVDDKEISMIKSKLGDCGDKFYQAWRVRNIATQKRFDDFCEKEGITTCKLLWHGSRNENWWSIINTGLMIRPSNAVYTGSMYGDAIYAAPKARKSLGYTSLNGSYWTKGNDNFGLMAIMDFAYGKPYDVYSFDGKYYKFNYEKLQKECPGANCLHAHGGTGMLRNDEIVFYNVEQCTIKYLVELRN